LEGQKPMEASGKGIWLIPNPLRGTFGGVLGPVGEVDIRQTNFKREAAPERAYGTSEGSKASKG
jgi:hypothetical protein